MSRNSHSRRRRPGRRPPCQGPAPWSQPNPQGFTGPGFRQVFNRILPGLKGSAKKQYFNDLSEAIVLIIGLAGAALGLMIFGWLGAILGLGAGLAAGGSFVETNRFHRR